MPCSRVFRSSAPSERLPSSRGRRLGRRATVDAAALDQWNGGSAPVRRATSTGLPSWADLEGMLSGPVRSQGEGRTIRDPELAARSAAGTAGPNRRPRALASTPGRPCSACRAASASAVMRRIRSVNGRQTGRLNLR